MEKFRESYVTNYKNVVVRISDGSIIKGRSIFVTCTIGFLIFSGFHTSNLLQLSQKKQRKILKQYFLSIKTILFGLALKTKRELKDMIRYILGAAIGATIGGLIGYLGKCSGSG